MTNITDEMLEAGVDAMIKFEAKQAALKVSEIDLDTYKYVKVFSTALTEGDRAAAILIFAYVEECLSKLIERHFDASIATIADLTRPNGLLATSSARLTLAAGLGWVNRQTFDALNLLRKIRNYFAHHVDISTFDSNVIKGLIASLPHMEEGAIAAYLQGAEPRKLNVRELFFLRSASTLNRLSVQGAVYPAARLHRVGPGDVLAQDEGLQNVAEMHRATSRIICHVYQNGPRTALPADWVRLGGRKEGIDGDRP